MSVADPNWFEGFFGADYLTIAPNGPERTTREVDFAVERLALEPPARILDLASGHGRHAIELSRRGFRVTGFDLSEPSLAPARDTAASEGVALDLVRGDMRELPWERQFDAVINLFTAFGYFADEADDVRVLHGVARALGPGGSFLIDVVSPFVLARGFRPRDWHELEDGRVMLEERAFDQLSGRSEVTWTFLGAGGERAELRHSLRVYGLPDLRDLLERAGLGIAETCGGFDGQPYGFESRRLIVHARLKA